MEAAPAVADAPDLRVTARLFQVLADPTRLAILRLLVQHEHSVVELVNALQVPRSRVSNHLACLRWCQLVHAERVGRTVTYRLSDPRLAGLLTDGSQLAGQHRQQLGACARLGPDWI